MKTWNYRAFDFDQLDGRVCKVITANGSEFNATCFKYYPASDRPEIWYDDWITNDPRCLDQKNGRLTGDQEVVAWRLLGVQP